MELIILFSVLITCTIFITIYLSIQAKKITNSYLYNEEYRDADENKSPFVYIKDDKGFEIILNINAVQVITKTNSLNEYLIGIWYINDETDTPTSLHFYNEIDRDSIFNKLYDYTLNE